MKPALTVEEWEWVFAGGISGAYFLNNEETEVRLSHHATAAFCLFGDLDNGFTREDVEFLRSTIRHFEAAGPASYGREEELRSLAGRIEALLPPESDPFEADAAATFGLG